MNVMKYSFMKKWMSGLCASLFTISGTFAQISTKVPTVITPSPNATAIGKYGEIPIGYSTGVPSIGVPLFNWEKKDLKINLSLNYHAGGIKVQDIASDVGLGWSLSGIPRISRTVMGIPDDRQIGGYMHTPAFPNDFPETFESYIPNQQKGFVFTSAGVCVGNPHSSEGVSNTNSTHYNLVKNIENNTLDGQQDVFNYNCNGNSGKFIISKTKEVIFLEHNNDKIQLFFDNTYNNLASFILTDQNGVQYFFEEKERQSTQSFSISTGANNTTLTDEYTASWLITKIRIPEINEEVLFEYQTINQMYEASFNESTTWSSEDKFTDKFSISLGQLNRGEISSSFQIIQSKTKKISRIIFPYNNIIDFFYNQNRLDVSSDLALTEIRVKNNLNQIIKQHKLQFDYFTSPSAQIYHNVGYYISGNDYSKRLQLTQINEISANNADTLITKFEYNPTLLNRRDSRNIDLWGYNINPLRNNTNFLPTIKLKNGDNPNNFYNQFLLGADRTPDESFCKAGVLEKIIYPTGGSTSFEYELNEAYNANFFYEDEKASNELSFNQTEWNVFKSLQMPERNNENEARIYVKAKELNPRPNNNGQTQPCLPETQDLFVTQIQVKSTDNTIVRDLFIPYNQLLNNYTALVDLPSSKTYQLKFMYNYSNSCEYQFPFTVSAYIAYKVEKFSKKVGGLRIKKIISNDGQNNTNEREFEYKLTSGKSSALMFRPPNFNYYKTTTSTYQETPFVDCYFMLYLNRSGTSNQSLSFMGGAPTLYTRILEKFPNNGYIERIYDEINPAWFDTETYPYKDYVFPEIIYNSLKSEKVFNNSNQLLQEKIVTTNINLEPIFGSKSFVVGSVATLIGSVSNPNDGTIFKSKKLEYYKAWQQVESITTKEYSNGNVLIKTEQKTYDPTYKYPRTSTTTDSKGNVNSIHFSYPFDFATYNLMVQKNNISKLVSETKKLSVGGGIPQDLVTTKINFSTWFNNGYFLPSLAETSYNNGTFKKDYEVNEYDTKANILQTTDKAGIVTSYIYGYSSQYPVAKIVGTTWATANAVFNTADLAKINNPSSDIALRTVLQKLRTNLSNVFVSTYTYAPLIGITSETDPNNKTTYYEYDSFNRLKLIRDFNNNILKTFDYKYKQ